MTALREGPRFSIVIPVHNEADVLESEVAAVVEGLEGQGLDYELLLVENGSTDATLTLARRLAAADPRIRVLSSPVPDYGAAMHLGMARSRGERVVNFDIDYHDVAFVEQADALTDRYGIVVGSKIMSASEDRRPPLRKVVSRGFVLVLRLLFDPRVDDTHGIKLFRRDVVDAYLPHTRSAKDLFDTELVLRARRGGVEVGALPVVVEEKRKARSSIIGRIPRSVAGLVRLRLIFWRERLHGQ